MVRILLAAALLAILCGCNSPTPLAQVTGVVLLDGSPVEEVQVEFLPDPDKGTHGPRSTGTTDAQGRFHLVCDDGRPGAIVGTHRVLVQDPRSFPPPRPRPGAPATVSPARVHVRYTKATDTPLRKEVQAGEQSVKVEVASRPQFGSDIKDMVELMSPITTEKLVQAGWTADRIVNVAALEAMLLAKGFVLPEAARTITSRFNGITLRSSNPVSLPTLLAFDVEAGTKIADLQDVQRVEKTMESVMTPVGFVDSGTLLLVGDDGQIIATEGDWLFVLGSSIDHALDNMFAGRIPERRFVDES